MITYLRNGCLLIAGGFVIIMFFFFNLKLAGMVVMTLGAISIPFYLVDHEKAFKYLIIKMKSG